MPVLTRRTLLGAALALPVPALGQSARRPLTVAVQANPVLFDSPHVESNVAYRVLASIHETLLDYAFVDGGQRIVPALAESWRRLSWRSVEVTLRDNVVFHDGTRMTAEDVAFSLSPQRLLADVPGSANAGRAYWSHLDRVEIVDKLRVRIHVKSDDVMLEHRLANWCSEIVPAAAVVAAGDPIAFARRPVGAGPFKLVEARADDVIVLTPHMDYWGGAPAISELRFRVIPELAARSAALETGLADLITEVTPDQADRIAANPRLEVVGSPINNHRLIVYSAIENPVTRDPRVRRAMNMALDRKLIVDALLGGRTVVPRSLQFLSYGDMYLPDFPAYRQDLGAARQLLREAGYKGDPIVYPTLSGYYTAELSIAQACQAMWREAGLNVELAVRENFGQILGDAPGARGVRNWSNTAVFPDPLSSLSRQHGTRAIQGRYREWSNAEFDALAPILDTSTDLDTRRKAFRRMLEIWEHEDPCGTVIHQNFILYAKRKDLRWQPYPVHRMDFRPGNFRG